MKKFGFYYINDKDREVIAKGGFEDLSDAITYFASIKKLKVPQFNKIYKTVLINDK